MKLNKLTRLAAISAVVLGFAMHAQDAQAQCVNVAQALVFDAQVPETLNVCATVDNTFTTQVTDIDFQTVGATYDTGDYGCAILAAAAGGAIDESNATCSASGLARIVSDDQIGQAGLIAIQAGGAFNSQEVRLQFTVNDPIIDCPTGSDFILGSLFSNQTTPATWDYTGVGNIAADNAAAVTGAGNTGVGGDLNIYIGAELRTDEAAAAPYDSVTCDGAFDVTLYY